MNDDPGVVTFEVTWPIDEWPRHRNYTLWRRARTLAGGRGVRRIETELVRSTDTHVTMRYTYRVTPKIVRR